MYTPLQSHNALRSDTVLSPKQVHHRAAHMSVADTGCSTTIKIKTDWPSHSQYTHSTSIHNASQVSAKAQAPELRDSEALDLSRLDNFEVVNERYREQGVQFKNAIALHPSNPAFPPQSSQTIVLGGPKSGMIDLIFSPPVKAVQGCITSSSITTMTAFGYNEQVLSKDESLGRNLNDDQSHHPPNIQLTVQAPETEAIHRVRLRCGGGQLALADLRFSRAN